MITSPQLIELLDLLEARGYRLRSLSDTGLEVSEALRPGAVPNSPAAMTAEDMPALEIQDKEEEEKTAWAHIPGGRPAFLRRPEDLPKRSPWADVNGPDE